MKRRLALTAGALVAALSLSSCSTFDHSDVAATVNGHELTRDQLDRLVGSDAESAVVRAAISGWIQLAVVEGESYSSAPTSLDDLNLRISDTAYVPPAVSGIACVSALVTADPAAAAEAAAALAGGLSFDDAFATYNQNQNLMQTGGAIIDNTTGSDCLPLNSLDPFIETVAAMAPGDVSEVISVETVYVILEVRPWESVSGASQSAFLVAAQPDDVNADISVASRFGTWNPVTLAVEPTAAG